MNNARIAGASLKRDFEGCETTTVSGTSGYPWHFAKEIEDTFLDGES